MMEGRLDILDDINLPGYKILRAGRLTCMYKAGNLRYIKSGDVEIIRMIYGALRNEDWETITPLITNEIIEEKNGGFKITYTATYTAKGIHYSAGFYIEGKADNIIIFSMKGIALNGFKKNRIGLCVLHPLKECCGKTVLITKPGEEIYESIFPALIAPYQPFKEVQKMKWQPCEDLYVQLDLTGDVFETEDQRNWSDSSFKTYCTPLDIPFPVWVKEGEELEQTVTLKVRGASEKVSVTHGRENKSSAAFPKLGYARPLFKNSISRESLQLFKEYPFHHYRVEINMRHNTWEQELQTAFEVSVVLQTMLEFILFFDDSYEQAINAFLEKIKGFEQNIYSVLLLHPSHKVTTSEIMRFGYNCVKNTFPSIKVGYGTDAYFAELNRNRPGNLPHDFVSFSLTPQVHATDAISVTENLECQPDIIKTIKSFTDKAIHVSPVSLYKRKNFDATSGDTDIIKHVTPIQQNDFEKHWFENCVLQLSGADCISFYR